MGGGEREGGRGADVKDRDRKLNRSKRQKRDKERQRGMKEEGKGRDGEVE